MLSGSRRWSARVQTYRRHWVGDSSNSHLLGAVVGDLGRRDSRVGFKDIGADGFEVQQPGVWNFALDPCVRVCPAPLGDGLGCAFTQSCKLRGAAEFSNDFFRFHAELKHSFN